MFKIIINKRKLKMLRKVEELQSVLQMIDKTTNEIIFSLMHNDMIGKTLSEDDCRQLCRKRDQIINELKFE